MKNTIPSTQTRRSWRALTGAAFTLGALAMSCSAGGGAADEAPFDFSVNGSSSENAPPSASQQPASPGASSNGGSADEPDETNGSAGGDADDADLPGTNAEGNAEDVPVDPGSNDAPPARDDDRDDDDGDRDDDDDRDRDDDDRDDDDDDRDDDDDDDDRDDDDRDDDDGGQPNPPNPPPPGTDTVTFTEAVYPILVSNCARCHASGGLPNLASANIDTAFNTAVRESGEIVELISDGEMPADTCNGPPGSNGCVSVADFDVIRRWVAAGRPR